MVVFGLAIALAVAEIVVRVLYPPMEVEVSRVDYTRDAGKIKSFGKLGADEIDGYPDQALYIMTPAGKRMLPNSVVKIRHHALSGRDITIRVNSFGFRGPEIPETKTRSRILFLGDSVTFGDFMAEEETFVHLVGAKLGRDDFDVDTINAGVGSIGMENELAILLDTGFAAEPDVVVLDFYLNDAEPSPGVWIARPPAWLRWSALAGLVYSTVSKVDGKKGDFATGAEFERWKTEMEGRFAKEADRSRDSRVFRAKALSSFRDWGSAWSRDAWSERLEPCLKAFKKACDARGVAFVVVCFPVRAQVEAEAPHDFPQKTMGGLCGELGIPYLDLLPKLREMFKSGGGKVFYDQCHPTPRTAASIADWITEFLERTEAERLRRKASGKETRK